MINRQLINPSSLVIIGGSNDISKPGGKIIKNILDGRFSGQLYVVNPKEKEVQGIVCYADVSLLPMVDLAILAIPARFCPAAVEILAKEKGTKAFIILSAGFSEESHEGAILENQIKSVVDSVGGSLIGPNCIGVLTPWHHSVFTLPIPSLKTEGIDFISGSGATACFILEAAIPKGLTFASVFSVGNSAQTGVEEILEYFDCTFDPEASSRIKLLYIENIQNPAKLLKHSRSLIAKGCRIAAIKAGSSEEGSRAASSHTGAMATPDFAVDTLFRKAGIVRCHSREELIAVATVFTYKPLQGKNIAVITHAGGPAVMLTDALSKGELSVPLINHPKAQELLARLNPGSSVSNPIDFLATGTAEQLGTIMEYVDTYFTEIDAMAVIFGTPGLFPIYEVYDVLHTWMQRCTKPVYPVLPSTLTAEGEVKYFIEKGHAIFSDEVALGRALAKVYATPSPSALSPVQPKADVKMIRYIIDSADSGYLPPVQLQNILDAAGIPRVQEYVAGSPEEAVAMAEKIGFPLVMKSVGPLHKSDQGGVVLNVQHTKAVEEHFYQLMNIEGGRAVMLQPMLTGQELFIGAKFEPSFGHMILCGLGGIFIEILHDVSSSLAPVSKEEALAMIRILKGYRLFTGVRGKQSISEAVFADIITRVSALLVAAPEIVELDLNPLLGNSDIIVAVDARLRIEK